LSRLALVISYIDGVIMFTSGVFTDRVIMFESCRVAFYFIFVFGRENRHGVRKRKSFFLQIVIAFCYYQRKTAPPPYHRIIRRSPKQIQYHICIVTNHGDAKYLIPFSSKILCLILLSVAIDVTFNVVVPLPRQR